MKFFATAAVIAVTAAKVAAYDLETPCPPSEINKLIALALEPTLPGCQDDSQFTFVPPEGEPNDEQIFAMCASENCRTTLAVLLSLEPSDCMTSFSSGSALNVKRLAELFKPTCKDLGFEW